MINTCSIPVNGRLRLMNSDWLTVIHGGHGGLSPTSWCWLMIDHDSLVTEPCKNSLSFRKISRPVNLTINLSIPTANRPSNSNAIRTYSAILASPILAKRKQTIVPESLCTSIICWAKSKGPTSRGNGDVPAALFSFFSGVEGASGSSYRERPRIKINKITGSQNQRFQTWALDVSAVFYDLAPDTPCPPVMREKYWNNMHLLTYMGRPQMPASALLWSFGKTSNIWYATANISMVNFGDR